MTPGCVMPGFAAPDAGAPADTAVGATMPGCITPERLHRVILAVADEVIAHEAELTALDRAIGDGDHGLNMRRGFEAVRTGAEALAALPLPDALQEAGTRLVMSVGGAAGPLYGTLLLTLGREIAPDGSNLAPALVAAVAAVMARGRSQPGQKTMLDVLAPVREAVVAAGEAGRAQLPRTLPGIAGAAAAATVPLRAARGRAAFLGERSVGHMDPGARSAALMVAAGCRAWRG